MNKPLNLKVDNAKREILDVFDMTSVKAPGVLQSRKILVKKARDITIQGWSENLNELRDFLTKVSFHADQASIDKKVDGIEFFKDADGRDMCRFIVQTKEKESAIKELSLQELTENGNGAALATTFRLRKLAFNHFEKKARPSADLCTSFVTVFFTLLTAPVVWLYELFTKPDKPIHDQVAGITPVELKQKDRVSHDTALQQLKFLKTIVTKPTQQSDAPQTDEMSKILDYAYLSGVQIQEGRRSTDLYKKRAIAEEIGEQLLQCKMHGAYISKDSEGVLRRINGPLLLSIGAGEGKHASTHFLLFERQPNGDLYFKHIRNLSPGTTPLSSEVVSTYKCNYTTYDDLTRFVGSILSFPHGNSAFFDQYGQQGVFEGDRDQDPLTNFFEGAPVAVEGRATVNVPDAAGVNQEKTVPLCTLVPAAADSKPRVEVRSRDPLLLLFATLGELSQSVAIDSLDVAQSKAYFYTSYVQEYIEFIEKNEKRLSTAEKIEALKGIRFYLSETRRHLEIEIGVNNAHAICDHLEKYVEEKLQREDLTKLLEEDQIEHIHRLFRPALKNTRLKYALPKEVSQVQKMQAAKIDELRPVTVDPKITQKLEEIREQFERHLAPALVSRKDVHPASISMPLEAGYSPSDFHPASLIHESRAGKIHKLMSEVVADTEALLATKDRDNCEAAKFILKELTGKLPTEEIEIEAFWDKLSLEELKLFSKLLKEMTDKFFEAIVRSRNVGEGSKGLFSITPEETLEFNIVLRLLTDHLYQRIIPHAPMEFDREWVAKMGTLANNEGAALKEDKKEADSVAPAADVQPSKEVVISKLQKELHLLRKTEEDAIKVKVGKILVQRYKCQDDKFRAEQDKRKDDIKELQSDITGIKKQADVLYTLDAKARYKSILVEYSTSGVSQPQEDPADKRVRIVEDAFNTHPKFIDLKEKALCLFNQKDNQQKYVELTLRIEELILKNKISPLNKNDSNELKNKQHKIKVLDADFKAELEKFKDDIEFQNLLSDCFYNENTHGIRIYFAEKQDPAFKAIKAKIKQSIAEDKAEAIALIKQRIDAIQKTYDEEEVLHDKECLERMDRDLPQQHEWACGTSIFIQQICNALLQGNSLAFESSMAFRKFILWNSFNELTEQELLDAGFTMPEKALVGSYKDPDMDYSEAGKLNLNVAEDLLGKRHFLFGRLLRAMEFDGEVLGTYIDCVNYGFRGNVRMQNAEDHKNYLLWDDESFHFGGNDKTQSRYASACKLYRKIKEKNNCDATQETKIPGFTRFVSTLPKLPKVKTRFKKLNKIFNKVQQHIGTKTGNAQRVRGVTHSERLIEGFSLSRTKEGTLTKEERKEVKRLRTSWATAFTNEIDFDEKNRTTPLASRARMHITRHEMMVQFLENPLLTKFQTSSAPGINSKDKPIADLKSAVSEIAAKKRVYLVADDTTLLVDGAKVVNGVAGVVSSGVIKDDDFVMPCFVFSSNADRREGGTYSLDLDSIANFSKIPTNTNLHSSSREEFIGEIGLEVGKYGCGKGSVRTEAEMAVYGSKQKNYPELGDTIKELLANTLLLYKSNGIVSPNSILQIFNFLNRRDNLVLLSENSRIRSRFYHVMYHIDPVSGRSLLEKAMLETDADGKVILKDGKPIVRSIVNQWLTNLESLSHGFLKQHEEEYLPTLMLCNLLKDSMRRYLVKFEGEEAATKREDVLNSQKAKTHALAFFNSNSNINQKFAAYYYLAFLEREEEHFTITEASGYSMLRAYYCLRTSPTPGDLYDLKKEIETAYLSKWVPGIASLNNEEIDSLLNKSYKLRLDKTWQKVGAWKRVPGKPTQYECQGYHTDKGNENHLQTVTVDLATLDGIEFKLSMSNRKEIPEKVRKSPTFIKLYGANFKQLVLHKGKPKDKVQEYYWEDKKTKVIHRVVCTTKEDGAIQWNAFQKMAHGNAQYLYMPMTGSQENGNPEVNGIADGFFDYGLRRFFQNSTSPQIEEIIKDKGMWLPLKKGSDTKIDLSQKVLVPFYEQDITRNPLAIVIKGDTIKRVYMEGRERLQVLGSAYSSDTRPFKFLNSLRGFVLLGNKGVIKEIRFPTRSERRIYEEVHNKKRGAEVLDGNGEKEIVDGDVEANEELPLILVKGKEKGGKERWYVQGRADWEWQLDHTEEVAAIYGANWRNYVLPLVNRKTNKHEYIIYPYQPYAFSGERTGDVRFMRGLQDLVSFVGREKMTTFIEKHLNDALSEVDAQERIDIKRRRKAQALKEGLSEAQAEALGEAEAAKAYSVVGNIPIKITPALVEALLNCLTTSAGGMDTIADLVKELSKRPIEGGGEKDESLKIAEAFMERIVGTLSEFISPQSFVIKDGKSGEESSHFGFFYLSHIQALRGNFKQGANYLQKMVDRGVSSDEDIKQFKEQFMPMIFLEGARKLGMMPGEFKDLLKDPASLIKTLQDSSSSFVNSNNPAEIAFEIKRILATVKVARILALKKQEHILGGQEREDRFLEFAGILFEKNSKLLLNNKQLLQEANLLFDEGELELLNAIFLTNSVASALAGALFVEKAPKNPTVVPFDITVNSDALFSDPGLANFSRAVAAYHGRPESIKEIHRKHGKSPKADTVVAHFFDYAHWILHENPSESEVAFLATNLEADGYPSPHLEEHSLKDPYPEGMLKARVNGLKAQHPHNVDIARKWLLMLFYSREQIKDNAAGREQLRQLQGALESCSKARKTVADSTLAEQEQAKILHRASQEPSLSATLQGLVAGGVQDALRKKGQTTIREEEVGNQRFSEGGPVKKLEDFAHLFLKDVRTIFTPHAALIKPVDFVPRVAKPQPIDPDQAADQALSALMKFTIMANPTKSAQLKAVRRGEVSKTHWNAQSEKLAKRPLPIPITVKKAKDYEFVHKYYEDCFVTDPSMENKWKDRAIAARKFFNKKNALGKRQLKLQREMIAGIDHSEKLLNERTRNSALDKRKMARLQLFVTKRHVVTSEKKEKAAQLILKNAEKYSVILGLSDLFSDRKRYNNHTIINDFILERYQQGKFSKLNNSSLQTNFEEDITEYLFLATEWQQQKNALALLEKLKGENENSLDWILTSGDLKLCLLRGHDRYRYCSDRTKLPILEEPELARHSLVTEDRQGWIARDVAFKTLKKMLADVRTRALKYPDEAVRLSIARMGMGKSSYILTLAAQISVETGKNPVVMTTAKLIKQLVGELDDSTPGRIFDLDFQFGTMGVSWSQKEIDRLDQLEQENNYEEADAIRDKKTVDHLTRIKNNLYSLQERGHFVATTPEAVAGVRNQITALWREFRQASRNGADDTPHMVAIMQELDLLEDIYNYLSNTNISIIIDEDPTRDVGYEFNVATGDATRPMDRVHYIIIEKILAVLMKDPELERMFFKNELRALSCDNGKIKEVLEEYFKNGFSINQPTESIEHAMVHLVSELLKDEAFWIEPNSLAGLTFGGAGFDPEDWAIIKEQVMDFVFVPKQANEPCAIDLKGIPLNKEHGPYRYLSALQSIMSLGQTFNTVYKVNAELGRGRDPKNPLKISPYQDGRPKPKVQYGQEFEGNIHAQSSYILGGNNFTSERLFDTQFKLFKQDKETPILLPTSLRVEKDSEVAKIRAKIGLTIPNTWQEWAENITNASGYFGFPIEAGGEYHAFCGTQLEGGAMAIPEDLQRALVYERMLYHKWAAYESGKIKVYTKQLTTNSRSLPGQNQKMTTATAGYGTGLFRIGDNLDHRDDTTGETVLLMDMDAPILQEHIFGNNSKDAVAHIEKCVQDLRCVAIINQEYAVEGGSTTALVRKLRRTCNRQFHFRNERLEKVTWDPGADAPVPYSHDRVDPNSCTIYAPRDSRGVDFRVPRGADNYGVIMVGLNTTQDAHNQALGRMRQLGFGQNVKESFDEKMETRIRKENGLQKSRCVVHRPCF